MTKAEARRFFTDARRNIPEAVRRRSSYAICNAIEESEIYKKCDKLFAYFPVRSEVDVSRLVSRAISDKKTVAFPVCRGKEMVFCRFDGGLRRGVYDIPEPVTDEEISPDEKTLCIVPGLAYDLRGYRLGYGGGYYDRFLKDFAGTALGVFYSELCSPSLPKDEYDIPLNFIITDRGFIET